MCMKHMKLMTIKPPPPPLVKSNNSANDRLKMIHEIKELQKFEYDCGLEIYNILVNSSSPSGLINLINHAESLCKDYLDKTGLEPNLLKIVSEAFRHLQYVSSNLNYGLGFMKSENMNESELSKHIELLHRINRKGE